MLVSFAHLLASTANPLFAESLAIANVRGGKLFPMAQNDADSQHHHSYSYNEKSDKKGCSHIICVFLYSTKLSKLPESANSNTNQLIDKIEMKITDLKPEALFRFFHEITQIPRPSKKEEKIIAYLKEFAKKRNLECDQDAVGNIVIRKPASPGYEDRTPVILQSHIDMVCEKNSDKQHDFDNDPITTIIEGDWMRADGTTLGADNGIGVATTLAVLDDPTIQHGPLEGFFTVDEETGMTGAMGLEPGFLKGDILINLDSEDEGEMFIGCAGGMNTTGLLSYQPEATPANLQFFEIEVSGLKGGHSGGDIHVGLGNANKILARVLHEVAKKIDFRLASFEGGNLHNAIPREAKAVIGIAPNRREELTVEVNVLAAEIEKELHKVDPGLRIVVGSTEAPQAIIDEASSAKLLQCLFVMPNGVMGMSHEIEGLVETSTNLAAVKMKPNETIAIETSQRSSLESQKRYICDIIREHLLIAGAEVTFSDGYPGWAPNNESAILQATMDAYETLFGKKPLVKAIHAGLECGLFLEKYPHLDMVSFGPTMRDVHSPQERLQLSTVEPFWQHLLEVLKHIPAKK